MKIKTGDKVIVRTGKDRGKEGVVSKTLRQSNRVLIDGINMHKKFVKAGAGKQGGIIDVPVPVHVSNVGVVDPKSKKPTRVGFEIDKKGNKVRVAKKSGTTLS